MEKGDVFYRSGIQVNKALLKYYEGLNINITFGEFKTIAIMNITELLNIALAFMHHISVLKEFEIMSAQRINLYDLKSKMFNDILEVFRKGDE